jgi:hypothetical protein
MATQPFYYQPQIPVGIAAPQQAHVNWISATKAEVNAQNIATAEASGVTKLSNLVPYKPADGQQWWCCELDRSFTLRTTNDITDNLQLSECWMYASSRYPYFIRAPAPQT